MPAWSSTARRPPTDDRGQYQGAAAAALCRPGRPHQCRRPGFEEALKEGGKTYTLYRYEGVNHAFNNDTSEARYDEAAAKLAWERTIDFFKANLATTA